MEILFVICFLIGLFVLVDIAYCLVKAVIKLFRNKKGVKEDAN